MEEFFFDPSRSLQPFRTQQPKERRTQNQFSGGSRFRYRHRACVERFFRFDLLASNFEIGIPAIVEKRTKGTIVSPWPPSTNAFTSRTEQSKASAKNVRKRAESRTPAMPITRCAWKLAGFSRNVHHSVQRIGHDDQHAVRRKLYDSVRSHF
jgi:hypothetical protein